MENHSEVSKGIQFQYNFDEGWLQAFAASVHTDVKDHTLILPAQAGTGSIRHWTTDDIAFTSWDCTLANHIAPELSDLHDCYSISCFYTYEHLPSGKDRSFMVFFGPGAAALRHFRQDGIKTKAVHLLIKKDYFNQFITPHLPVERQSFTDKTLANKDILVALIQFSEEIEKNTGNNLYIQGKIYYFLSLFLDLYIHQKSAKKRYLTQVEQLMVLNKSMEQKCFEDLISIPEMAEALHISVTKFKQLFAEVYDTSYLQYHIKKRLLAAQELLRQPKIRMGEIALKTGYSGISHFAKAYKKHFGNTPSDYHREYLKLIGQSE